MLALLLAAALAWESSDCNLGAEFPAPPTPVATPAGSARGAWGWTYDDPATRTGLNLSCVWYPEVLEPAGAAEVLRLTADQLVAALGGTEVARRELTWLGVPSLELDMLAHAGTATPRVRVRMGVIGSRLIQLQVLQTDGGPIPPAAAAFFDTARVLRDLGELPPSRVAVTWSEWASSDGAVSLRHPDGKPSTGATSGIAAGVTVPFRVTSWHADGHGTFGVRWAPVPASLAAGRTPEQVLDALVAMQLDPMKPEQLQTADVAWPGGLARDVSGVMGSMRQRGVWPFRGRVLLVGDRVVIAIAYDQQAEFDAEAADTFVRGVTPGG